MKNDQIPANYRQLAGSERHMATGAKRVSDADPNERINITICVRRRPDGQPLPDHEYWMKTPPGRRKYLAHKEFAGKHGATQADLDAVAQFARSHGMEVVETHDARRTVIASGTVAQVSAAFAVNLGSYEYGHGKYRGREGFVHIPNELAGIIEGVFGLDNRRMAKRANNPINIASITPPQLANYYKFPTSGAVGQTIGIYEASDPTPGAGLSGYTQNDMNLYFGTNMGIGPNFTPPVLQDVSINGATNSPGSNSGNDQEVIMDIQIAGGIAEGVNIAVYFTTWDENGWVMALKAMTHPNPGQPS